MAARRVLGRRILNRMLLSPEDEMRAESSSDAALEKTLLTKRESPFPSMDQTLERPMLTLPMETLAAMTAKSSRAQPAAVYAKRPAPPSLCPSWSIKLFFTSAMVFLSVCPALPGLVHLSL